MGLHPDVKKHLRERFPACVNDDVPAVAADVIVWDAMWSLFKFHSNDDTKCGEDLIEFLWWPLERFFLAGGNTYVVCFDIPEHVPNAKAEEHAKRYGSAPPEPLTSTECSFRKLPAPWRSALANRRVRAQVCAFIAAGFEQRFEKKKGTFPNPTAHIIVHGTGDAIKKISFSGCRDMPEHAGACKIGEGDLSVAYWAHHFHASNVVARVLDSDQVPILMLRAHLTEWNDPDAPSGELYVWLVNPKNNPDVATGNYPYMPREQHTLIDILALNAAVQKRGTDIAEYVLWIIAQKTDFTLKVIQNLGVAQSMLALEKARTGAVRVTASHAHCDGRRVSASFKRAATDSKRGNAEVIKSHETELRRSWWTLLYW